MLGKGRRQRPRRRKGLGAPAQSVPGGRPCSASCSRSRSRLAARDHRAPSDPSASQEPFRRKRFSPLPPARPREARSVFSSTSADRLGSDSLAPTEPSSRARRERRRGPRLRQGRAHPYPRASAIPSTPRIPFKRESIRPVGFSSGRVPSSSSPLAHASRSPLFRRSRRAACPHRPWSSSRAASSCSPWPGRPRATPSSPRPEAP